MISGDMLLLLILSLFIIICVVWYICHIAVDYDHVGYEFKFPNSESCLNEIVTHVYFCKRRLLSDFIPLFTNNVSHWFMMLQTKNDYYILDPDVYMIIYVWRLSDYPKKLYVIKNMHVAHPTWTVRDYLELAGKKWHTMNFTLFDVNCQKFVMDMLNETTLDNKDVRLKGRALQKQVIHELIENDDVKNTE